MENNVKHVRITSINPKIRNFIVSGLVLAVTVTTVSVVSGQIKKHAEKVDLGNKESIVRYYGESSDVTQILRYLEISEKLDTLNLNSYEFGEDVKVNLGVYPNELLEVSELEATLDRYLELSNKKGKAVSTDDAYYKMRLGAILSTQNAVIKSKKRGWQNSAYKDYVKKLKGYVASEFGIDNPSSITLWRSFEKGEGKCYYTVSYQGPYGIECSESINDKYIQDGIDHMIDEQNADGNKLDSRKYAATVSFTINFGNETKTKSR